MPVVNLSTKNQTLESKRFATAGVACLHLLCPLHVSAATNQKGEGRKDRNCTQTAGIASFICRACSIKLNGTRCQEVRRPHALEPEPSALALRALRQPAGYDGTVHRKRLALELIWHYSGCTPVRVRVARCEIHRVELYVLHRPAEMPALVDAHGRCGAPPCVHRPCGFRRGRNGRRFEF